MRITGGHALGDQAAGVVQQAVSLAGRRGHAQVTPLHIASAMLSGSATSPPGILRSACVRSQSHLLQHNALDLCLNAALDRRAMASAAANGARVDPVPSNAFAAALKRARAQPRRGDKVELEQLVLAILDDPSVDRVMRAAGFSSSLLVENAVLSEQSDGAGRQPSLQTVYRSVVAHIRDHGSEIQASQEKSGPPSPALFDRSKVVATTSILPPWLLRYKETIPSRSTRYSITSLQADLAARRGPKFTELTAHNMKILCDALELRFPGHGDIVPGISSTVLLCRSGMVRKQQSSPLSTTTWLLFRGRDSEGKTAVARELARLVFGSHTEFTALQAGNSEEPTRSGKLTHKRRRSPGDGNGGYPGARLFEAILENPHRVIYIDGVDRPMEMRIKDTMVEGTVRGCNGEVVGLDDAIVVLCSDMFDSRFIVSPPQVKQRVGEGDATGKEVRPRLPLGLDLNACPEDREDEEDSLADGEEILNFVDGVFLFN